MRNPEQTKTGIVALQRGCIVDYRGCIWGVIKLIENFSPNRNSYLNHLKSFRISSGGELEIFIRIQYIMYTLKLIYIVESSLLFSHEFSNL